MRRWRVAVGITPLMPHRTNLNDSRKWRIKERRNAFPAMWVGNAISTTRVCWSNSHDRSELQLDLRPRGSRVQLRIEFVRTQ